jgi:hypothetical protein
MIGFHGNHRRSALYAALLVSLAGLAAKDVGTERQAARRTVAGKI